MQTVRLWHELWGDEDAEVQEARDELARATKMRKLAELEARARYNIIKPRWKVIAVLIAMYSGRTDLAQLFLFNRAWEHDLLESFYAFEVDSAQLVQWMKERCSWQTLVASLNDVSSRPRFQAERFLIESLLVQYIDEHNQKGICVPVHVLVTFYARLWSWHGYTPASAAHVQRLLYGPRHARRKWAEEFRMEWPVGFGSLERSKELEDTVMVKRVHDMSTRLFATPLCSHNAYESLQGTHL